MPVPDSQALVGRDDVIAAFERLVHPDTTRPLLLVDGLSGTGKTYLLQWLRRSMRGKLPMAAVTLAPGMHEREVLRSLAAQIGRAAEDEYTRRIEEWSKHQKSLLSVSVTQSAEGRLGGSVSEVEQKVTLNFNDPAVLLDLEARTARLDAVCEALRELRDIPWVLFIDETEHLTQPEISRFILTELLPRLRTRFSGLRLYLTGQSVPAESLPRQESVRITLATFDLRQTAELLRRGGFDDEEAHEAVFRLTGGHPLLIAMWLDGAPAAGEFMPGADVALDEASRARWIYDRVVSRFDDPAVRRIAANLSLLEWFDLGLIRAIYEEEVSEQAFEQMLRRSFIKTRDGKRWECHDIIRKHLPPHRMAIDPEGCRQFYVDSGRALTERLRLRAEQAGSDAFPDRLPIVLGILNALLGHSFEQASQFLMHEVAWALARTPEGDYLYAIGRYLEHREEGGRFAGVVADIRWVLDAISARRSSRQLITVLERFRGAASAAGDDSVASELLQVAALLSSGIGDAPGAIAFAESAVLTHDSEDARAVLLGRLLVHRELDRAAEALHEWKEQRGDSVTLRKARASLAEARGQAQEAIRELTDALAIFPDAAAEIFLVLAQGSRARGDLKSALQHLDAALERAPGNADALLHKTAVLAGLGRFQAAGELLRRVGDALPAIMSAEVTELYGFSRPGVRERLLLDFQEDPSSLPPPVAITLVSSFAMEGRVDVVDEMTGKMTACWPEISELATIARASARLLAGRPAEVAGLLQPLIDRDSAYLDAYFSLSRALQQEKRFAEMREVLTRGSRNVPGGADLFDALQAMSFLQEEKTADALRFLDRRKAESGQPEGPQVANVRAQIHLMNGDQEQALQVLDEAVRTEGLDSASAPMLVQLRLSLVVLLDQMGDRKRASEELETMLALFPGIPPAIVGATQIYEHWQDERGLRRLAREASRQPILIRVMVLEAAMRVLHLRYQTVDDLLRYLERERDAVEVIFAIDLLLTAAGRFQEMGPAFERAEALSPGIGVEHMLIRRAALEKEGVRLAANLREMAKAKPNDISVLFGLAEALAATGALDEALEVMDRVMVLQPATAVGVTGWKVGHLVEADRLQEAGALVEPYLAENAPIPGELYPAIENVLKAENRQDDLVAFYRRMAATVPAVRRRAIIDLATALAGQGDPAGALAELGQLDDDRLDVNDLLLKLRALQAAGAYDRAEEVVERIAARENLTASIRAVVEVERGDALRLRGNVSEAIEAYRRALAIDDMFLTAHLGLSTAFEAAGDDRQAYEHLRQAVALQPSLAARETGRLQKLRPPA